MKPVLATLLLLAGAGPKVLAQEPSKSGEMARLAELAKPGKEHRELAKLAGEWSVAMSMGGRAVGKGKATGATILGNRFLVLDGELGAKDNRSAFRFTIGFDRRNNEYEVTLLDNAGTYSVVARGKPDGERIRVFGTDNDPVMKKMGLAKKFAFELQLKQEDKFGIIIFFVDTRTPEEKLLPAFQYDFQRRK